MKSNFTKKLKTTGIALRDFAEGAMIGAKSTIPPAAICLMMVGNVALAAPPMLDLNSIVTKVFTLLFGCFFLAGVIVLVPNLIKGAKAILSDGGGEPAGGTLKTIGGIFLGFLLCASPWISKYLLGFDPFNVNIF